MLDLELEIANVNFVINNLNEIVTVYKNNVNQTKEDYNFQMKICNMISTLEKKVIEMQENKDDVIYQYKNSFYDMIREIKQLNYDNRFRDKPVAINYKQYNEKAYTKLNYLFRRNKIMSYEVAKNYYQNADMLHDRYVSFIDLITWINDNGLSLICEKVLFSAFLNISVDTYNELLMNANQDVRDVLTNIDEGFTTQQFGVLMGSKSSMERIQRTEKYGQEMKSTQTESQTNNNAFILSLEDLMKRKEIMDKSIGNNKKGVIDYKE